VLVTGSTEVFKLIIIVCDFQTLYVSHGVIIGEEQAINK